MTLISASVGNGGANKPTEVKYVKSLLNSHFSRVPALTKLAENESAGADLFRAIRVFQFAMGVRAPDGLVSPGGKTLKTLQMKPEVYRLEGKSIKGHKEDNSSNLKKRKLINDNAVDKDGSLLWAYDVKKDDFPVNSNKCNKFVFDIIKESGIEAYVTVRGTRRPPLAAEWADKNTEIPGWRVLIGPEPRKAGDVAAYALTGGGTSYSGHTGFIITHDQGLGNISAHTRDVSPDPGQFENKRNTAYRRYMGE